MIAADQVMTCRPNTVHQGLPHAHVVTTLCIGSSVRYSNVGIPGAADALLTATCGESCRSIQAVLGDEGEISRLLCGIF